MKNLEEIRGRCRIEDGHWLWTGATRPDGRPHVFAPDYTRGGMQAQPGARAVVHCKSGKAIPNGWRAFGTCDEKACLNPEHIRCAPAAQLGAFIARTGVLKGKTARILANRAIGRARSRLSPQLIAEIQASDESGAAVARRLHLSPQLVSKVRRGDIASHQALGVFTGLQFLTPSRRSSSV